MSLAKKKDSDAAAICKLCLPSGPWFCGTIAAERLMPSDLVEDLAHYVSGTLPSSRCNCVCHFLIAAEAKRKGIR